MLTLNDGRSELWQWDTGRTLAVDADCSQVHFSNKVFGRSIDVDVVDGAAIIPDILLQTDNDLNVWAFVGTAENGYTKISKTFKVNRRNKPADYVFTPPDQTSLEEIKERLEYLEQNPVESPVQSVNGRTGAVELNAEDVGAISVETDPTVPGWAKQPEKPTYTAAEVGALPDTYTPPVDSTMTKSGQAADAAVVGNRLSALSKEIADLPQPDWNQNDDTQPDYVKNRPFYTGAVETVIVEESTVSFTRNEYIGLYSAILQSTFVPTVGDIYKVSWDGTAYECTCVDSNGNTIIGNLSILGAGSDTGEPFIVGVIKGVGIQIATADTSASHTFSISGFAQEVVKIDRKYLPKAAFITYDSSTSTYNSDLTYDELYEILLNGEQIVLHRTSVNRYFYTMMWAKKSNGEINLSFDGKEFQITLFPDGTIGEPSP